MSLFQTSNSKERSSCSKVNRSKRRTRPKFKRAAVAPSKTRTRRIRISLQVVMEKRRRRHPLKYLEQRAVNPGERRAKPRDRSPLGRKLTLLSCVRAKNRCNRPGSSSLASYLRTAKTMGRRNELSDRRTRSLEYQASTLNRDAAARAFGAILVPISIRKLYHIMNCLKY